MPKQRRTMPRTARAKKQQLHTRPPGPDARGVCEVGPIDAANRLCAAGRVAEASTVLSGALGGGPEDAPLLYEMAQIRLRLRDIAGALSLLESAVAMTPSDGNLHFALAAAYIGDGRRDLAEAECELAIRFAPSHGRAHNLLGWLTMERGDAQTALVHFQNALQHDPQSVDAWLNASVAFNRIGEYAQARSLCEAMTRQWPGHAGVWINLGMACKGLRDLAAAREAFQHASASPLARFNLGHVALLQGDVATGLPLMEARRDVFALGAGLAKPAWRRGERQPKRLLVIPEQGMGDTILMSRFLPLLAARADRVIAVVQPALERLFASAFPNVEVRSEVGGAQYDAWAPVMSLPHLLGIDALERIPTAPWIAASHAPQRRADAPLRIGLNWAGNAQYAYDAVRSTSLDSLALLLRVPDVEWVSLHRGAREQDALRYRLPTPLAAARDFADTAAAIAACDLVISTETAVPNLSAAMGVPTIVLSSTDPDWRWRGWYHDVTVCAQETPGDWAPVVVQTLQVLQQRLPQLRRSVPPMKAHAA